MGKDAFYFPHDSNARQDVKILKLRVRHGWSGYGLYWGVIEALRDQDDYSFDASEPELISLAVGCSADELMPVLETCLEVGLLVQENGCIYSPSLKRRMERVDEIREKRREAGKKGGRVRQSVSDTETNDEQNTSNCLANDEQMLSIKEKKRKEYKRKENNKNKEPTHAQAHADVSARKAKRTKFVTNLFEEQFWKLYPRKKAKKDALKAFQALFPVSLSKEQCNKRWQNIVHHIDALVAEARPPDKLPYPATFLRRESFDEPPAEMTSSNVPEMEFVEVEADDE